MLVNVSSKSRWIKSIHWFLFHLLLHFAFSSTLHSWDQDLVVQCIGRLKSGKVSNKMFSCLQQLIFLSNSRLQFLVLVFRIPLNQNIVLLHAMDWQMNVLWYAEIAVIFFSNFMKWEQTFRSSAISCYFLDAQFMVLHQCTCKSVP